MLMKGKLYCMLTKGRCKKMFDPDVIRTRSLLIWSQTRYRCATESTYLQREKIEKETK